MAFGAGVLRNEGNAVGAHEACNIRTDHMAAKELFQGPEHGIIVEGAALHDDFISQIRCLPETNHLVEGIFND